MIKDRALKATALRYLTSKRYFPQLEVMVLPRVATGASNGHAGAPMTDIDVLGLAPDEFDAYRSILIDCRTLKNQSPVGRAFWLCGVMKELQSRRGICVLRGENVEPDHRLSAADLDVMLITEVEFEQYIVATGGTASDAGAQSSRIELWEEFLSIPTRYRALSELTALANSAFWQPNSAASSCRRTLAALRRMKGELDPAKRDHKAIVTNTSALFLIAVAQIVSKVFTGYLQPKAIEQLSEALLMILYGGKETYDTLNALKKLSKASPDSKEELSLPEWPRFIQFVRETLEAPVELAKSPLLLRELAWGELAGGADVSFAMRLAAESPLAAKYALLGTEYLCRAAQLPPEFAADLTSQIMLLQNPPG